MSKETGYKVIEFESWEASQDPDTEGETLFSGTREDCQKWCSDNWNAKPMGILWAVREATETETEDAETHSDE
jgi:hypothetical protein